MTFLEKFQFPNWIKKKKKESWKRTKTSKEIKGIAIIYLKNHQGQIVL